MRNNTQESWEEELKYKLPQIILTALEYRGFYDCGKYLDDTIWESIEPLIRSLLSKQAEEISEKYLQALKEPEEWCLQHYGYATKEQEEEIYKEGMDAMRAYKTIRFLAIKQVINK